MRPPKEFDKQKFHWVRRIVFEEPMAWAGDSWWRLGVNFGTTSEQAEHQGWVWLGVAEPPENGWETRG